MRSVHRFPVDGDLGHFQFAAIPSDAIYEHSGTFLLAVLESCGVRGVCPALEDTAQQFSGVAVPSLQCVCAHTAYGLSPPGAALSLRMKLLAIVIFFLNIYLAAPGL